MSWLGTALSTGVSAVTGGNVTRLAVTALIAASAGAWGAWQVQQWRWKANTAAETLQRAESAIEQEKFRSKALQAAIVNTTNSEEIYEAKLKETERKAARNAQQRADLKRVLDDAQCGAIQGVRNGQPAGGYDATDTRWQLDRGRVRAN